jgi:response regulator RpfG family c-di-GMP phosphodiesterase
MTRAVLDASGYRVLTARNGAEAVDLCARHPEPIDLVVMDLVMPVMDGSSAIRSLRDRQVTAKSLPSVASPRLPDMRTMAGIWRFFRNHPRHRFFSRRCRKNSITSSARYRSIIELRLVNALSALVI